MKILLDMNMSPQWAAFLRTAGIEAPHWSELRGAAESDAQIMVYTAEHGMTVLTLDLDNGILLAQSGDALPSVVQLRMDDVLPALAGEKVLAALVQLRESLDHGALVTVDTKKTRFRVLPLRPKL